MVLYFLNSLKKKIKNKLAILISIIFFIHSCSGLGAKRSDKSDEFLIEKKNPLRMPPNIDELPEPKEEIVSEKDNEFQNILKSKKFDNTNTNQKTSSNLEESIIKQIEQ